MARKKIRNEMIDVGIRGSERVKLTLPRRLLFRAIANQVNLDKLVTFCLECLLDHPGGPQGIAIQPYVYALAMRDGDIETRRLFRVDGVEVHSETEDLNPDLPLYQ